MYAVEVYCDNRSKDPCMLELHSKWRCVVNSNIWCFILIYGTSSPVKVLLEIINGRFGGFHSRNGEEKIQMPLIDMNPESET
jgi:hypothetical protein